MSDVDAMNASHFRPFALERAAADAWEKDHPSTPWEQAPASVRASMRALVAPVVDSTLAVVAPVLSGPAAPLPAVTPEPDTFPPGTPHNGAISATGETARRYGITVRHVYRGVPLIAYPGDSWQDVAGRYEAAATAALDQ